MKTYKELNEELYISDLRDFAETFSQFSDEDFENFVSEGKLTEEEVNQIKVIVEDWDWKDIKKKAKEVGQTAVDAAAGYGRGLLGRERFNRWGSTIRSKTFGTDPEEEKKKLEKDYEIRSKRSPTATSRGETTGTVIRKYVAPVAVGVGAGRVLKPIVGTVPALVGGAAAGAAASNTIEKGQESPSDKSSGKPIPTLAPKTEIPKAPEAPKTEIPKAMKPEIKKTSVPVPKEDDLARAKELIKKREAARSPIYKIGDVAGKVGGGSKEFESGVKDTYARLAKDPKASAEFLKIQQQRNKDMGL